MVVLLIVNQGNFAPLTTTGILLFLQQEVGERRCVQRFRYCFPDRVTDGEKLFVDYVWLIGLVWVLIALVLAVIILWTGSD